MRTNLKVPYDEKDDAKKLGARWDAARKTWYVENVENIEQFMRWMPNEVGSILTVRTSVAPMNVGARFFRISCSCLPWDPCDACLAKVAAAGWGLPA